jgi:selenocysteine-specific elongation factor
LPLRHGDRVVLRDPGSRTLWGADVLDADPPPFTRRGAARTRAAVLEDWRPDLAAELERRGFARASRLRQLGVTGPVPASATAIGDWLVSAHQASIWRDSLFRAVAGQPTGISTAAAARVVGLPDPKLVAAMTVGPLRLLAGRLVAESALPEDLQAALDTVRARLADAPFIAPTAVELGAAGLDRRLLARLGRDGHLLVLGDGVVLLPGADSQAYRVLGALPQPFTTSQARQALGTSRRVVLPLLAHLDRTGRTVRLPDDMRRVIRRPAPTGA